MENFELTDQLINRIRLQDNIIVSLTQQLADMQQYYCEKGFFIDKLLNEIESLKLKLAQIKSILTNEA